MNAVTVPLHSLRRTGVSGRQDLQSSGVFLIDEDLTVVACDSAGNMRTVNLPDSVQPRDLCTGPGGSLYVLASDEDGSRVFRARDAQEHWSEMRVDALLTRIACGPDEKLWAVDEVNGVRSFPFGADTQEIVEQENFAEEISVGGDGRVWIISTEERYAGRVVKWRKRGEQSWTALPAPSAAVKLSAAPDGVAWTVNSMGAIWRLHPLGSGNFAECQVDTDCERCIFGSRREFAKDIAVDGAGNVWALSVNQVKGGYQLIKLVDRHTKQFQTLDVAGIRVVASV